MRTITVTLLRVVLATCLAVAVVVQAMIIPALWRDLDDAPPAGRVALVTITFLFILALQVTAVCMWRLVTMVHRDTIFSTDAFRYVDIVIGAVACASVLVFAVAVILAPGEIAPGVILLICGCSLLVGGVALIVLVLRMLLAKAVALDTTAHQLQSELDEVI